MAPEKSFKDPVEALAPVLKNLVRLSSTLNQQDLLFYNSIDQEVNSQSMESNSALIDVMNRLTSSALTITPDLHAEDLKIKENGDEQNFNVISNVLDTLFENVEIQLDNFYNKKETSAVATSDDIVDDGYTYLDENDAKNGINQQQSKGKPQSSNIDKPQLDFIENVDNFETGPFKPLITTKPNAIKPFGEVMQICEPTDDIPSHYENPYSYEIMNCEYPEWILSSHSDEYISTPWKGSEKAIWISEPIQLKDVVLELSKSKVIAIDLEHHDYRTYHGLTSLMQITSESKIDYLIDPLSPNLRPHLQLLNEVFTDPSIVKVLHGAFMDIIWLQRDLGLYIVSLFDTFHASKQLNLGKHSLAFLLEKYVKFKTSKKWQLADWRIRPLSNEMKDYAKADTHFLIEVFYKMQKELLKIPDAMQRTLYESRKVSNRRFEYSTFEPLNLRTMKSPQVVSTNSSVPLLPDIQDKICSLNFTNRDLPWTWLILSNGVQSDRKPLLEILYKWRDQKARKDDESPRYIMSDFILMSLVNSFDVISPNSKPEDITNSLVLEVINKSAKFGSGIYIRKCIDELVLVIRNAVTELSGFDLKVLEDVNNFTNDKASADGLAVVDEDHIYESIKDVNKLQNDFQSLISSMASNGVKLQNINSRVKVIKEEESPFAIEYQANGNGKTIEHINDRIQDVVEYFQEDQAQIVELDIEEEDIAAEEEEKRQYEAKKELQKKVIEEKEEIVTLRKRKQFEPGQGNKKRKPEDDMKLDFLDFNKSVMGNVVEDKKRRRGKQPKQQPSFDPYSRIDSANGAIPQLKKQKRVDRGRNAVIKKRK